MVDRQEPQIPPPRLSVFIHTFTMSANFTLPQAGQSCNEGHGRADTPDQTLGGLVNRQLSPNQAVPMLALPAIHSALLRPRQSIVRAIALLFAAACLAPTHCFAQQVVGQEMIVEPGFADPGYMSYDHAPPGYVAQSPFAHLRSCTLDWFPNFEGWPPLYTRFEYLGWWTSTSNIGPLVTTSVPTPASPTNAGAFGQPGTTVLFAGAADDDLRSGARIHLGVWLNACRTAGFEATYLGLAEWNTQFSANQTTHEVLARPYISSTGLMESHLIAFPSVLDGSVSVDNATKFNSLEFAYRRVFRPAETLHWDMLIGYRTARLDDSLTIDESLSSLDAASGQPVGTTTLLSDRFSADNRFHGIQFGLVSFTRSGRLGLELSSRLALGGTRTQIVIDGSRTVTPAGGAATSNPNGLLAQPTNAGTYNMTNFAVIPELGVNLTYNITNHTSLTLGYRALYWSTVGLAADQIDPVLNLSQVPPGTLVGSANPEFQFLKSSFWAQGVTAGVDIRF